MNRVPQYRFIALAAAAAAPLVCASCARVRVDPIEVKTIHIVHDVNIRVDKQLDEFFAFQEQAATQPATVAVTQPATTAAAAAATTTQATPDVAGVTK